MSDQQEQDQEQKEAAPPTSEDSAAVQAALEGIPGLSAAVGSRPSTPQDSTAGLTDESEEEAPAFGTPREPAEDSETVQQALKQLGLQ